MKILTTLLLFFPAVFLPVHAEIHTEDLIYVEDPNSFEDFNLPYASCEIRALLLQTCSRAANDKIKSPYKHPKIDYKNIILNCAQNSRAAANDELQIAEDLVDKIITVKNWRSKDRLKVLVASSMGTALIPNAKVKLLSVALALLTDLVIHEGFEKVELFYHLYRSLSIATGHLEMYSYYCELSIKGHPGLNIGVPKHSPFLYANFVIDELTRADMLTTSLEYIYDGSILSSHIVKIRKSIMNDMLRYRKFTRSYKSDIESLLENYGEMVIECRSKRDRKFLFNSAYEDLKTALFYAEEAEKMWGIKN